MTTARPRNQSVFQKPDFITLRRSPCPCRNQRRTIPLKTAGSRALLQSNISRVKCLRGFWASAAEQRSRLDVARGKKLRGCDFFPIAELGAQHLDAAALGRDLEGLLRRFNDFADFSLDRAEGADRQLARVEDL